MTGSVRLESDQLSIGETDDEVLVAVVRTGDLSGAVTIQYGVTNDTAVRGQDYQGSGGFVTLQPGQDRVLIPITILDDAASEQTEDFVVSIINISSGFLEAPRTARVSILDDENPVDDPVDPPLVSDYVVNQIPVLTGLSQPIDFEFAPQDRDLVYVAEKQGLIEVYNTQTGNQVSTFLDIRNQVNNTGDRGLLDIALHPDFPNTPFLYAFYVVDPADTAGQTGNAGRDGAGNRFAWVVRYEADAATDFTTLKAGSETILVGGAGQTLADISGNGAVNSTSNLTIPASDVDPATGAYVNDYIKLDSLSHAGGALAFGPDGALYISTGDGTSFNAVDPRTVSVQDVNALAGKILRVDPITGRGLADNPFFEPGMSLDDNAAKVFQLGLRNPFSMGFDANGRLMITDTGWNSYEELNVGGPGANFGWPFYEGGDFGELTTPNGYRNLPEAAGFYAAVERGDIEITAPFRGFSHRSADPGFQFQAITGGNVAYDGGRYPEEFDNAYFFSDFSQGEVFIVDPNDRRDVTFLYKVDGRAPGHFGQGPDGLVYYADLVSGSIGKLEIGVSELNAQFFTIGAVSSLSQINFNAAPAFETTVGKIEYADGSGGFWQGGPSDRFAAKFEGEFTAESAGNYTFYLSSDDGSVLFIDGQQVINNDGLHAFQQQTATVNLSAGAHDIEVRYFENTGNAGLDLDWAGPGFGREQMTFVSFIPESQGPDAVDDARTTPANTSFWFNVLDNDLDREGGGLVTRLLDGPDNAETFQFDTDGDVFYRPDAGFVGVERLVYEVVDDAGATDTATFTITVGQPGNRAPVARNDQRETGVGQSFWFNVLDNDTDADGDALFTTLLDGPDNGTFQFDLDGDVFYRPDPGFVGVDTLRYRAEDGKSPGDVATFTITVGNPGNTNPVARNDQRETAPGQSFWFNVLDNDTDADGDELFTFLIDGPDNGTIQFDLDGDVFYRPNAGFVGVETLRYRAEDASGGSDTATFTITVGDPDNADPVARNDARSTDAGQSFWFNVLDNDTDADGDELFTFLIDGPDNGTFQFDLDGDVFYRPDAGFSGVDTLRYRVEDGNGGSDTAVFQITVGTAAAQSLVSDDALVSVQLPAAPSDGSSDGSSDGPVLTNASMGRVVLDDFGAPAPSVVLQDVDDGPLPHLLPPTTWELTPLSDDWFL